MSDEPQRVYRELEPIARSEAEAALASGDASAITWTLICLGAFEPDWPWVIERCHAFSAHPDANVRNAVALSVEYLARFQGIFDLDDALSMLRALTSDAEPDVAVAAQESLDQIQWLRRLDQRASIKAAKMANIITADYDLSIPDLVMNNGLASVFLLALLLSGAEIARTDWEVSALVWLAEHDQDIVGVGTVGFDVSELAWTRDQFAEQQACMLAAIDGALARHGWETLTYAPKEDWVLPALAAFREMIARLTTEQAYDLPRGTAWSTADLRSDRARCPHHGVYLHNLRPSDDDCCIVCNDS